MTQMKIRKRTVGTTLVVELEGDLDSRSAPDAGARLCKMMSAEPRMIVDLTGVPYMSSAGLRTMLLLYRQAQSRDAAVALVGLSNDLRSMMQATGFLDFFVVAASPDDAAAALCGRTEVAPDGQPVPGP